MPAIGIFSKNIALMWSLFTDSPPPQVPLCVYPTRLSPWQSKFKNEILYSIQPVFSIMLLGIPLFKCQQECLHLLSYRDCSRSPYTEQMRVWKHTEELKPSPGKYPNTSGPGFRDTFHSVQWVVGLSWPSWNRRAHFLTLLHNCTHSAPLLSPKVQYSHPHSLCYFRWHDSPFSSPVFLRLHWG